MFNSFFDTTENPVIYKAGLKLILISYSNNSNSLRGIKARNKNTRRRSIEMELEELDKSLLTNGF